MQMNNSIDNSDIIVEMGRMTFHNLTLQLAFSGFGLTGLTCLLAVHYHNDKVLYAIAWAMLIVISVRMSLVFRFKKIDVPSCSIQTAYQIQLIYAMATLVYCCLIAFATLYSFVYHDSTAWTLCILGTFLISATFITRNSLNTRMVQASGLVMVAALAFSFIRLNDSIDRFGVVPILFYALVYVRSVQDKFESSVEQIRGRHTLRMLAEHDSLTGLANRRHFETILQTFCSAEAPFAILFIDLDQFKAVNDTFGHPTGDRLLQEVGKRLQATARSHDIVSRLGGDEFAILQAPASTRSSAEALAHRINISIAELFEINGHRISIGTSIGIRLSSPHDKDTVLLLSRVDQALYHAKKSGRGGYFFDSSDQMQIEGRSQMTSV